MTHYTQHYVIEWDKVKTLEDLKLTIKAINITFEPDFEDLSSLGDFVKLENKPPIRFI